MTFFQYYPKEIHVSMLTIKILQCPEFITFYNKDIAHGYVS